MWWIEHICSCWLHNLFVYLGKKKSNRACFRCFVRAQMHLHICNRFYYSPETPIFGVLFFSSLLIIAIFCSLRYFAKAQTAVDITRQAGWQAGTSYTALSKTCCTNKNVFRITTTDFDSIKFISNEKCSRWAEQLPRIRWGRRNERGIDTTENRHYVHRKWKARDEVRNKIVIFPPFWFDKIVFGIIYCFPDGDAHTHTFHTQIRIFCGKKKH